MFDRNCPIHSRGRAFDALKALEWISSTAAVTCPPEIERIEFQRPSMGPRRHISTVSWIGGSRRSRIADRRLPRIELSAALVVARFLDTNLARGGRKLELSEGTGVDAVALLAKIDLPHGLSGVAGRVDQ